MSALTRKQTVLVVDDIETNRMILEDLLHTRFDVLEACDGIEALAMLEKRQDIAIVLLDIIMPRLDGFGVLSAMQASGRIQATPVVLITSENDDALALKGYKMGVSDLIYKPFNPEIVYRRVCNVVDLYNHRQILELRLQEQKEMLDKQAERLRQSNQFIIDALSTTVEFRSMESGEHIKRVRLLTHSLLVRASAIYPLAPETIEVISSASAMHDIGKIAIPDSILLKPGPLTDEEFEIMKTHTTRGCEILETLTYTQDPEYYQYCYEICRHHHEKWDGRGYPDGLKGDEIPIWAQAASLADVFDALTSKRVYKDAYSDQEAHDMILRGECGAFNPELLKCFEDMVREEYGAR